MNDTSKIDTRTQLSLELNQAPPKLAGAVEAREVAQQFEAIFLRKIVKDMRTNASSMTGGGMMGEGVGADVREGWFDTFMADHLASSRRVGLGDALYRSWVEAGKVEPEGEEASEAEVAATKRKIQDADNQALGLMHGLSSTVGGI